MYYNDEDSKQETWRHVQYYSVTLIYHVTQLV